MYILENYKVVEELDVTVSLHRWRSFGSNFAIVENGGKLGLFNTDDGYNKLLLPCEYDGIKQVGRESTFILKKGDKYDLCDFVAYDYDVKINLLTDWEFEEIELNTDSGDDVFILKNGNFGELRAYIPHLLHLTKSCASVDIRLNHLITHTEEDVVEVISLETGKGVCVFDENDFVRYFGGRENQAQI